jgi:LPS-assembly protein
VCAGVLVTLLALAPGTPAFAAEPAPANPPIVFSADEVVYDDVRQVVRASGDVEVSRVDRVLRADEIVYDRTGDTLTARGNVSLVGPEGDIAFADKATITGDLKDGIIKDLRLIFRDGSRLAAAGGRRSAGTVTEMYNAVYSPCELCEANPAEPPLWQIKAVKVTHDKTEKTVEFSDAWLEFAGVPVFYLPYVYQPDPTVQRKTGFLAPTFANSSDFGLLAQVPYYIVISPHEDVTLTPWMTSNENALLEAEYRRALTHGAIEFDGSFTRDSNQQTRGHVFGEVRYDLDDAWRAGLDVERTKDRTYLRRYGFSNDETLTSRLFAEAFPNATDYFSADAYLFQGLRRDDDNDEIPVVAPKLDYYRVGDVDALGGRTNLHLDLAVFTRNDGTDTRRTSARARWDRPIMGAIGDVFTASAALWGDLYHVNDLRQDERDDRYTGFSGRLFPQVGGQWRLPLVREGETIQQIVEPVIEAIYAPSYGNSNKIPNEDSEEIEFDHTNVFGFQRFPGIDRVEKGPRVNYGLSWSLYGQDNARATFFVGQTYRVLEDDTFPSGSGLGGNFSDVVTSVDLAPHEYLDLYYRNRYDVEDMAVRRHELGALVGSRTLRVGASYVRFDSEAQEEFQSREELDFVLTSQISRYWRTRISGIRDLTGGGAQRDLGIRFTYEDECFLFSIGYAREDIEDRDIEPSDVVFVRVGFKTFAGDAGGGLRRRGG